MAPSRVLVVHDDVAVGQDLKTVLEAEGCVVALAEDGPQALDILRREEHDVLLLELILPGVHGFEVLEQLQADPHLRDLPVIVMSPHERRRDLAQGLEMGATDYLTYPIERSFLRARLAAALASYHLKGKEKDYSDCVHSLIRAAAAMREDGFEPSALDKIARRDDALGQLGRLFQDFGQEVMARGKSPTRVLEELRGELLQTLHLQQSRSNLAGRLLVVDNDLTSRKLLSIYLSQIGYEIENARDGAEALELLAVRSFDILVTDLEMPNLDGYQLMAQLKADQRWHDLPVIVISSNDDAASMARSIEAGATDHFAKPFNPQLLAARLRACLVGKRLRDQELAYLGGVTTLTQAAASMEEEDFDPESLSEIARSSDSLGRLARVFQRMAREILSRQQSLKRQVTDLKTELEQARQRSKLADSTQSDYFHTLDSEPAPAGAGRVCVFSSFRGGTGKSNLVANLAYLLGTAGCKVGVLDAAIQSPGIHKLFGLSSADLGKSFQDYLFERCDLAAVVMDLTDRFLPDTVGGRLLLLPACNKINTMARLLRQGYEPNRLASAIKGMVSDYKLDILLIDTQGGLNEEVLLSFLLAQRVVIVLRPDQQDYEGTGVVVQVAQKLKVPLFQLLINQAPPSLAPDYKRQMADTFGCEVASLLPHLDQMLSQASGGLFCRDNPEHPMTLAMRELALSLVS